MATAKTADRRPLATLEQVAEYLGVEVQTLRNWRSQKKGPRSTKVGGLVRYRWRDVDAYVEAGLSEQ